MASKDQYYLIELMGNSNISASENVIHGPFPSVSKARKFVEDDTTSFLDEDEDTPEDGETNYFNDYIILKYEGCISPVPRIVKNVVIKDIEYAPPKDRQSN